MPLPSPTAEAITLHDIPPLPIFAYVPSVTVCLVLALLLIAIGWLVLRAPRRSGIPPGDALAAVEAEIERCLARGVPRDGVFAVSRAVKVLLLTRARGDFTAETPGELRRCAEAGALPELSRALSILAELDESKYRPDRIALEATLRELREILPPLVAPSSSTPRGVGGTR